MTCSFSFRTIAAAFAFSTLTFSSATADISKWDQRDAAQFTQTELAAIAATMEAEIGDLATILLLRKAEGGAQECRTTFVKEGDLARASEAELREYSDCLANVLSALAEQLGALKAAQRKARPQVQFLVNCVGFLRDPQKRLPEVIAMLSTDMKTVKQGATTEYEQQIASAYEGFVAAAGGSA